jgi:hypothetical protein
MTAKRRRESDIEITDHALQRFRERWPESCAEPDQRIRQLIQDQVHRAHEQEDYVNTPGGTLYPITYLGKDGYVIVKGTRATTAGEEKWYPEATAIRNRRGHG